jgi:hypothetical protein
MEFALMSVEPYDSWLVGGLLHDQRRLKREQRGKEARQAAAEERNDNAKTSSDAGEQDPGGTEPDQGQGLGLADPAGGVDLHSREDGAAVKAQERQPVAKWFRSLLGRAH